MPRRVSSIAPLKRPPHDWQRIESRVQGESLLASHSGQRRESDLETKDELFTSYPFFMAMGYSEKVTPRNSASALLQEERPQRPLRFDPRGSRLALARSSRCRFRASPKASSRYSRLAELRS